MFDLDRNACFCEKVRYLKLCSDVNNPALHNFLHSHKHN
jgi:hypothetical protein